MRAPIWSGRWWADVCFSDPVPLHVSVAVGVPNTGVAGQSIVWAGGTTVKVGGVLSRTVIVWLTVAAESFPHASVAFQVRVKIGLAHDCTPITTSSRIPPSASN